MKNLNKKIVFFDIDGTIYRYGEPIPNDTLEAIKSLYFLDNSSNTSTTPSNRSAWYFKDST